MSPELVFKIANIAAMAGWIIMIAFPGKKITAIVIHKGWLPMLLSALYFATIAYGSFHGNGSGGFDSLGNVAELFKDPVVLLAGWVHYLAFDLLIGSRILLDSRKIGIHHLITVPLLFLTFVLGPIGYFLYKILRAFVLKNKPGVEEL